MKDETADLRQEVLRLAAEQYGTEPDHPWGTEDAVLRHGNSKKWFALLMEVRRDRLGLPGEGTVQVMNVKADPRLIASLAGQPGCLPAYHMNKEKWMTVLLDGTAPWDTVAFLLDGSYELTRSRPARRDALRGAAEWLVPANPRYYDVERGLRENGGVLRWKQTARVAAGDAVYLYVGAPVSAILYKLRVTEADIPADYADENIRMRKMMTLKLERRYDGTPVDRELMARYGVTSVRSQRGMPNRLARAIGKLYE